ncbi:MAG TPA: hypothetical protein PLC98_22515 [Anaerolineales bacterium]|nr:hypothetical protein [Anaerolineales bacterium]
MIEQVALTTAGTVLAGILVLVVGQIVERFVLAPLLEQHKVIGEIATALILYDNAGTDIVNLYATELASIALDSAENEVAREIEISRLKSLISEAYQRSDEASRNLRRLASELLARTQSIPCYGLFSLFGRPSRSKVILASTGLIGLSNLSGRHVNNSYFEDVSRSLGLRLLLRQRGVKERGS